MKKNIVVIGGGAAGMMAAIAASNENTNVELIEKNDSLGRKLFITGKGRCNVTNASDIDVIFNNIISNPKFLYSAIYSFDNNMVMDFFEQNGLKLKVERGNRVFPDSDHSSDVIKTLKNALEDKNVKIHFKTVLKDLILENGSIKGIVTNKGKIKADAVIIATGGVSYPVTGSDGEGLNILKKHGHSIAKLRPGLVPINVGEEYIKDLQGLSLRNINISIYNKNNKLLYSEFGEMLFTHFGVSGPVILSASSVVGKHLNSEELSLVIDLKPALDEDKLDKRILREFEENKNKNFINAINGILPKKMIPVFVDYVGIDSYKKVNEISKEERKKIVNGLKNFKFTLKALRGYNEAIITQGGINVKEINPATLESKIIKNLYLAGEMIDVDALTGGYNLQIAWSTGWLAGLCAGDVNEY